MKPKDTIGKKYCFPKGKLLKYDTFCHYRSGKTQTSLIGDETISEVSDIIWIQNTGIPYTDGYTIFILKIKEYNDIRRSFWVPSLLIRAIMDGDAVEYSAELNKQGFKRHGYGESPFEWL